MYFFIMGPKGSGKTTVAKSLQRVLSEPEWRERLSFEDVVYHHFPTHPPPDSIPEDQLHLFFQTDFARIGKKLHSESPLPRKVWIYDRSFVSTCIHQGLQADRPELIPQFVRQGINALARRKDGTYGKRRVCFLLVDPSDELVEQQDEDKWRPNKASIQELQRQFERMYEYLKVQLRIDQKNMPDKFSPMFVRFSNRPGSRGMPVDKQMDIYTDNLLRHNFKYRTQISGNPKDLNPPKNFDRVRNEYFNYN